MWSIFFILITKHVFCSNILFIAQLPSPSHYLWNKKLSLELVKNGHNVTLVSHDVDKEIINNFTLITLEELNEIEKHRFIMDELVSDSSIFNYNSKFLSFVDELCQLDIKSDGFKELMNYPADYKFDLVIFDISNIICLYGLISKFNNPPIIGVSALTLTPQTFYPFANPLYTSYMPYYLSKFTNQMSVTERLLNLLYTWSDVINYGYLSKSRQEGVSKIAFGSNSPSIHEMERNISLFLLNYDPILDYPIPLTPNIIPVGGLHAETPKPLSQDLELIINNHPHDIIYFALGTNLPSHVLTNNQVEIILKVFAKLHHLVLWKYNGKLSNNVPENVIIRKWFQQNDILGHSKTKLFITHCGALGTQEAMYHGVPMVGIPYFFDQHSNAQKLSLKQIAVILHHNDFTFENFYGAIREVLDNPKYKKNVEFISQMYKKQPQSAMERAVFWIEHVLRYGSVEYLNTPARDMPLYKLYNFDIYLLIIFSFSLVGLFIKQITLRLIRTVFPKPLKEKIT